MIVQIQIVIMTLMVIIKMLSIPIKIKLVQNYKFHLVHSPFNQTLLNQILTIYTLIDQLTEIHQLLISMFQFQTQNVYQMIYKDQKDHQKNIMNYKLFKNSDVNLMENTKKLIYQIKNYN
jgi:hypothetical protein